MIFENLIFQDFYYLGPSVGIIIIDIFTNKKSTLNKKNTGIILSVIFLMVSVEYHWYKKTIYNFISDYIIDGINPLVIFILSVTFPVIFLTLRGT
jgi:hypothetical protein